MNRIVIILISFGSLFCLSGCLEVSNKSEWSVKISNPFKKESPRPRIVNNDYPNSPRTIPALFASIETLDTYHSKEDINCLQEKSTKPKHRGFKKFTKKEI